MGQVRAVGQTFIVPSLNPLIPTSPVNLNAIPMTDTNLTNSSTESQPFGYVVINLSKLIPLCFEEPCYYVLPGEEPHTYANLESAAAQIAERIYEDGHTWDSIGVFELLRVAQETLEPLVQHALEELESD